MLLDHLAGSAAPAILERADGDARPALAAELFFADYEAWPAAEREAIDLVSGRVLDIGCGAGRHALHLERRGVEVVAIDVSPGAVEVARRRGARDVRLLAGEEIARTALGRFDAFLMMCGNFGLTGTPDGAVALLAALREVAEPDAIVVADCVDGPAVRLRLCYRSVVTPWFSWLNLPRRALISLVEETPWRVARIIDYDDEPSAYLAVLTTRG
jgi:SAM-dependent methyltransferase